MGRKKGFKQSKKTKTKISKSLKVRAVPHELSGRYEQKTPKKWITFEETGATLIAGSIRDTKPYDLFKAPQEAWDWWQENQEKFMKEHFKAGGRPNIFWELSMGISYPDHQLQEIADRNLWYPGEKEKLIEQGVKIPEPSKRGLLSREEKRKLEEQAKLNRLCPYCFTNSVETHVNNITCPKCDSFVQWYWDEEEKLEDEADLKKILEGDDWGSSSPEPQERELRDRAIQEGLCFRCLLFPDAPIEVSIKGLTSCPKCGFTIRRK